MRRKRRGANPDRILQGVLLMDKPAGVTSHEVCQVVKSRLRLGKVGHGGTLDPFATGLLPLLINGATRLAPYIQQRNKTYEAIIRLGTRTDTMDPTGEVIATGSTAGITEAQVREALAGFVGEQKQTIPLYASARVDGKHLYEYARAGEQVELPVKDVIIHSTELRGFTEREDGVDLDVVVACGSGTYMRALADDLGEQLGCGAHLSTLRRTVTGPFAIEAALTLQQVVDQADAWRVDRQAAVERGERNHFDEIEHAGRWATYLGAALVPVFRLLGDLPTLCLPEPFVKRVASGQGLRRSELLAMPLPADLSFTAGARLVLEHPNGLQAVALVRASCSSAALADGPPEAMIFEVERVLR